MRRNQRGFTLIELIVVGMIVVIAGFGGYGWVHNIIDIVHHTSGPVTKMFILRCVGIPIFPLGVVLGYM